MTSNEPTTAEIGDATTAEIGDAYALALAESRAWHASMVGTRATTYVVTYWTGKRVTVSADDVRDAFAMLGYVSGDGSHLFVIDDDDDGAPVAPWGIVKANGAECARIVPAPECAPRVRIIATLTGPCAVMVCATHDDAPCAWTTDDRAAWTRAAL